MSSKRRRRWDVVNESKEDEVEATQPPPSLLLSQDDEVKKNCKHLFSRQKVLGTTTALWMPCLRLKCLDCDYVRVEKKPSKRYTHLPDALLVQCLSFLRTQDMAHVPETCKLLNTIWNRLGDSHAGPTFVWPPRTREHEGKRTYSVKLRWWLWSSVDSYAPWPREVPKSITERPLCTSTRKFAMHAHDSRENENYPNAQMCHRGVASLDEWLQSKGKLRCPCCSSSVTKQLEQGVLLRQTRLMAAHCCCLCLRMPR